MRYFPLFLDIKDKPVLLVGGGEVAARKFHLLSDAGASITVVAPWLGVELTAAQAGVDPDGGVIAGALAHLAEGGTDELGGEVAVGLVCRHGEHEELAHAGRQVLFELGQ